MAHTYEELSKMTIAQLREIAGGVEHDAVKGHTQMHKDQILLALCTALGIDSHAHHHVVGLDKAKTKSQIRSLKKKRAAAIEAKNPVELRRLRHNIKKLKHKIRRATV
ncbi:MAG: hypothetical protein ACRD3V_05180 [Vicinamibacteria bacterium]